MGRLLVLGVAWVALGGGLATPAGADIVYDAPLCGAPGDSVPNAPPGSGACRIVIWRAGDDGSGARQLTDGPADGDPVWSPDGRRIAYTRGGGEAERYSARIWTMDANGGDRRQLTPTPRTPGEAQPPEDTTPAWSPDGLTVAFTSRRRLEDPEAPSGPDSHIWTIGADGRGLRPLTVAPGSQRTPAFSPDGLRVAYLAGAAPPFFTGVQTVPLTGGAPLPVTLTDLPVGAFSLAFSPDGTRLAFAIAGRLHAISALGGPPERLVDEYAGSVAWAASPPALYYSTSDGRQEVIRRVPAGGGEASDVAVGGAPDWHGDRLLGPVADVLAPVTALVPSLLTRAPGASAAARRRSPSPRLPLVIADSSGIRSVRAAVARRASGRCRFVARGRLGPRRSCRARRWFTVRDGQAWRTATRRLPDGRYRVWLAARDGAGNASRRPRGQNVVLR